MPKLSDWPLSVLVVTIWVVAWWRGTRRFRLWFALLAPALCLIGVVAGLLGALSGSDASCTSPSCPGSAVQRWAESMDAPPAGALWLESNALLALGVAVALTVLTLIVEYILLVRREPDGKRR